MGSTPKYSPSPRNSPSVVSALFSQQICLPSKCSFTLSKLRFFGLRKPKTTSFYSLSYGGWLSYFLVSPFCYVVYHIQHLPVERRLLRIIIQGVNSLGISQGVITLSPSATLLSIFCSKRVVITIFFVYLRDMCVINR